MNYFIFAAKFKLSNYLTDQSSLKKNANPKDKVSQQDLIDAKFVLDKWTRSTSMRSSDGLHRTGFSPYNWHYYLIATWRHNDLSQHYKIQY